MVYTSGRAWIEYLRIDEAHTILGLRLNVWTSILVFLVGVVGYALTSRRRLSDAVTDHGEPVADEPGAASREVEQAP